MYCVQANCTSLLFRIPWVLACLEVNLFRSGCIQSYSKKILNLTMDEPCRWIQDDCWQYHLFGPGTRHRLVLTGVHDDGHRSPIWHLLSQQQIGWGATVLQGTAPLCLYTRMLRSVRHLLHCTAIRRDDGHGMHLMAVLHDGQDWCAVGSAGVGARQRLATPDRVHPL